MLLCISLNIPGHNKLIKQKNKEALSCLILTVKVLYINLKHIENTQKKRATNFKNRGHKLQMHKSPCYQN